MREYASYRGRKARGGARKLLAVLLVLIVAGVLAFAALQFMIWREGRGQAAQAGGERTVMVIFGCQVKPDGPSVLLRDRLDTALAYWEEHPDIHIVVAGGKGDDEHISEAQCMYDYLTARGVDGANILKEDQSRNTHQNIQRTLALLGNGAAQWDMDSAPDRYVLVSSDFHLTRILMLWARATGRTDNVTTLPAPVSHAPSRVQMFFREPLALVKSFLLDREFVFEW